MLIDTHCHLDWEDFDADRDAVLLRAAEAGVITVLNPSTNLERSARIARLAEQYEPLFVAVGVHPNDSQGWGEESEGMLTHLAQHPKVVAIGEIGLDYYWNKAPKEKQREVFQQQLILAAKLDLPVIVHNREAGNDVVMMLTEWQAELVRINSALAARPGVLHSFSAECELAQKALAVNFFIGLTGPLTFKNAKELQTLATELPLDKLLVETDSPFLSPHPERGQRNEPAKVRMVAEKLAELKKMVFDEIAAATTANARALFRFGEC
ncbi:MAG: TatD family hydrolase [Anaerolineales bacterium]